MAETRFRVECVTSREDEDKRPEKDRELEPKEVLSKIAAMFVRV